MSTTTETKTLLKLMSSDNQLFEVEEAAAFLSETIKMSTEDGYDGGTIPLANVDGATLGKVVEWCKKHADKAVEAKELKEWDAAFVDVGQEKLYDLIMAANYLCIKELLDLICQKVADMIKGKTPDKIRETFNIKNDFTPEQEKEIREQNSWAFQ